MLHEITRVLDKMDIRTPSPIQQLTLPHLLKGHSALLAAQTGTGKTLSYVLPLIHRLKMTELEEGAQLSRAHRPRGLVVVPNRELVQQVVNDGFKPFHYEVPLKFAGVWPGQCHKIESAKLEAGMDCLVGTFERIQHRREGQKLFLSHLDTLVIDEFDTLVDMGQSDNIRRLLEGYLRADHKR